MELGDLQKTPTPKGWCFSGRNPRYNGIGWFTNPVERQLSLRSNVAILAIMELGDLPGIK